MSRDFLESVTAEKSKEVEGRRQVLPKAALEIMAARRPPARSVAHALHSGRCISILAEMKRASPSCGRLREIYDVPQIAGSYFENGAAAFSVLTDQNHFQGTLEHLEAVSRLNLLPVLRKDFIVDSYQVLEARAFGADAVLLIVAMLQKQHVAKLKIQAEALGMNCLVEVHQEEELETALSVDAKIIGINNRNLKTLQTSIAVTERLAPLVPRDRIIVSESGITSRADIVRLAAFGIEAVLVGTHLMRHADPGRALAELVGVPKQ